LSREILWEDERKLITDAKEPDGVLQMLFEFFVEDANLFSHQIFERPPKVAFQNGYQLVSDRQQEAASEVKLQLLGVFLEFGLGYVDLREYPPLPCAQHLELHLAAEEDPLHLQLEVASDWQQEPGVGKLVNVQVGDNVRDLEREAVLRLKGDEN
jgi:hypothetical protein